MNSDVMESVLHEILNEQKETSRSTKQLVNKMEYLFGKLENLAGGNKQASTHFF